MLEDATTEWVAEARHLTPLPPRPEDAPPPRHLREAQRAIVYAVLSLLCFGFLLGPMALRSSGRARLAFAAGEHTADAGLAEVAVKLGTLGMAVHLAVIITALPWLLFMLPLLGG